MLRMVNLVLVVLMGGVVAQASEDAVDALKPSNEAPITVQTRKIAVAEPQGPHDWLIKHPTILKLVDQTNQHRARMGYGPVTIDAQMCLDAQRHAVWMASGGGFQHSGLPYMEIIHQGVGTAEGAIQGWIASPAHHGIMLSGSRVGFGYMNLNGYPYWVGVFR